MADEKKTVKETQETGKTNKFVAFFKNLPQNIATPFKNMWHELKKVTWPTKPDLIKYVGIVVVFMVFMGVVIGAAISSLKGTEEQIILTEDTAATVDEAATEAAETVQEAVENETQQATEGTTEEAPANN